MSILCIMHASSCYIFCVMFTLYYTRDMGSVQISLEKMVLVWYIFTNPTVDFTHNFQPLQNRVKYFFT